MNLLLLLVLEKFSFSYNSNLTIVHFFLVTCCFQARSLKLHIKTYHDGIRPFLCTVEGCGKGFAHKVCRTIDRMQKWLPSNYSFVFVLISLTSLGSMRKIQKNFHTKMRPVSPISI